MLRPHDREDAELGEIGFPAHGVQDALIFLGREAVLGDHFGGDMGFAHGAPPSHDWPACPNPPGFRIGPCALPAPGGIMRPARTKQGSAIMPEVNWVAAVVAGIVGFFPGALWYSPLMFLKPWQTDMSLTGHPDGISFGARRASGIRSE